MSLTVAGHVNRYFTQFKFGEQAFALWHKILTQATFGPLAALNRLAGRMFNTPAFPPYKMSAKL